MRRWWPAFALLAIAFNLRVALTSVGPVLDDLRADLGLSHAGAGVLTTLPLLCFAAAGAAVPWLARRVGPEVALLAGMITLAAGAGLRIVPELAPLFLGPFVLGAGIAVANVLMPVVIKHEWTRPGAMMGGYVSVMTAGAALAAGLAVPLEDALGSWNAALAIWALPALVGAIAWFPVARVERRARRDAAFVVEHVPLSLRHDRVAWSLTGLFAGQSILFYAAITWLAELLRDGGLSDGSAGAMESLFLVLGIPVALVMPIVATRLRDQRPLVWGMGVLWGLGLIGLVVARTELVALWMVLLGIAQGGSFALSMTLVVLRAPDGPSATALAGLVQGIGYVLAAASPLVTGALHDVADGWTAVLWLLLAVAIVMVAVGLRAAAPGLVDARRKPAPDRA
jgi:CP family cyanate transporter-like MFS transporter